MEYLRLAIGLLTPWIAGFVFLRAVENRLGQSNSYSLFRQIGYAFFLGYFALFALITAYAAIFNTIDYWPITTAFIVAAAIGGILAHRSGPPTSGQTFTESNREMTKGGRLLLLLLLAWIAIHLGLAAIEVFNTPVFPWDAWASWMYRAKAWYFQGVAAPMISPSQWPQDASALSYNVPGHNYPSFVSTIALWVACSLGSWNDTLVNIPTLLCGTAVAMGIYGQCREYGGGLLSSTAAAYMLLSVPLLATHIALAGYADIWMAGFTGLGFAAMIRALICRDTYQSVLALLMTAFAITVKAEGLVWLLAMLALMIVVIRPRVSLAIICFLTVTIAAAWLTATASIQIPGLGPVGYIDGAVRLPFEVVYPIMLFDVSGDYLINFFLRGSWNILWGLVLLTLTLLVTPLNKRLRLPILYFYLAFIATQIIIFGFTEHGRWAQDSTSINRLPLHFVPAFIICLFFPVINLSRQNSDMSRVTKTASWRVILIPALIASIVVGAGMIAYLASRLPDNPGSARYFQPTDMSIVVGGGSVKDGVGIVNRYENDIAVISSGPINLDASALSLLRIKLGGDNGKSARFFWRSKLDPQKLEAITLPGTGLLILDLSLHPKWAGEIIELGVLVYRDDDKAMNFHQLAVLPQSVKSSLTQLWSDWTQHEPWTLSSNNWIAGGSLSPIVPLPVLLLAWLITAIIMYCLLARTSVVKSRTVVAGYCLFAWMVLDLRWTANSYVQAIPTLYTNNETAFQYIEFGGDREIAELVYLAKAAMPLEARSVLVAAQHPGMRFQMLRTKYHLLPHAAYVHEGSTSSVPEKPVDYVLILNQTYLQPGQTRPDILQTAALLGKSLGGKCRAVFSNETGTLFEVTPGSH